jgi:hypothetical protein
MLVAIRPARGTIDDANFRLSVVETGARSREAWVCATTVAASCLRSTVTEKGITPTEGYPREENEIANQEFCKE